MAQENPIGRNGMPMDVAKAMEYLADAPFVTGQILPVNGGYIL
jgi:pteridine reductase